MTSRERIIAATNHREPDRMPIDLGAMGSTGISILAYIRMKEELGIDTGRLSRVSDLGQQLAAVEPEVVDLFGVDVLNLWNPFYHYEDNSHLWKRWVNRDGSVCEVPVRFNPVIEDNGDMYIKKDGVVIASRAKDSLYFHHENIRYKHIEKVEQLKQIKWNEVSEEELDAIERQAKHLYENTDKAILYSFGGGMFEPNLEDFGHENFFMKMAAEPEFVCALNDMRSDHNVKLLKKVLSRIGKYIQVINFGDDLGTQRSPLMSPAMYRKLIKPYHQKMFMYVKEHYPHIKVFLHSCGAIAPLISDLIDAGVDILNPVQISASGMDPELLKKEYGKDLCFWGGGVDTQGVLLNGSIDEIKEQVKRLIGIFSPGGGYVFTTVHNIVADISPQRIQAVYKTAKETAGDIYHG